MDPNHARSARYYLLIFLQNKRIILNVACLIPLFFPAITAVAVAPYSDKGLSMLYWPLNVSLSDRDPVCFASGYACALEAGNWCLKLEDWGFDGPEVEFLRAGMKSRGVENVAIFLELFVDVDQRGKGWGSRGLDALLAACPPNTVAFLEAFPYEDLESDPNLESFFGSRGFKALRRTDAVFMYAFL